MVSLISTGSNYIIVIMGVIYAITCFTVFLPSTEKRQVKRMDRQELFMFVFHFICYGVLFAKTLDTKIIFLYLAQVVFFKMLIFVYSASSVTVPLTGSSGVARICSYTAFS